MDIFRGAIPCPLARIFGPGGGKTGPVFPPPLSQSSENIFCLFTFPARVTTPLHINRTPFVISKMSGIVTLHELDNSKSTLPPKNTASFTLKFVYVSGHLRWAQVRLSEFEGRFLKSYISSLPCCDKASVETFDLYIDRVHSRCYGEGKWLNAQ